jgi:uncharacterized protein (TIGR00251 family)
MKIRLRVKPGAPRTRFLGWGDDGTLTVAVSERPTDGEANRALVRFLAKEFGLSPDDVRITSGARSRLKVVELPGVTPEMIKAVLK